MNNFQFILVSFSVFIPIHNIFGLTERKKPKNVTNSITSVSDAFCICPNLKFLFQLQKLTFSTLINDFFSLPTLQAHSLIDLNVR